MTNSTEYFFRLTDRRTRPIHTPSPLPFSLFWLVHDHDVNQLHSRNLWTNQIVCFFTDESKPLSYTYNGYMYPGWTKTFSNWSESFTFFFSFTNNFEKMTGKRKRGHGWSSVKKKKQVPQPVSRNIKVRFVCPSLQGERLNYECSPGLHTVHLIFYDVMYHTSFVLVFIMS